MTRKPISPITSKEQIYNNARRDAHRDMREEGWLTITTLNYRANNTYTKRLRPKLGQSSIPAPIEIAKASTNKTRLSYEEFLRVKDYYADKK